MLQGKRIHRSGYFRILNNRFGYYVYMQTWPGNKHCSMACSDAAGDKNTGQDISQDMQSGYCLDITQTWPVSSSACSDDGGMQH